MAEIIVEGRVFFWQRVGGPGSAPIFSMPFRSAEDAERWAQDRADEVLWFRLLMHDSGQMIYDLTGPGPNEPLDARELVEVAERAPISDEAKKSVAAYCLGAAVREIRFAVDLRRAALDLQRLAQGVARG